MQEGELLHGYNRRSLAGTTWEASALLICSPASDGYLQHKSYSLASTHCKMGRKLAELVLAKPLPWYQLQQDIWSVRLVSDAERQLIDKLATVQFAV